jgi:signal peptidase I
LVSEQPDLALESDPGQPRPPKRSRRVWLEWTLTLAVSLVVVFAVRLEVASPYRIPSSSMEPALHCAQPVAGCEASFSDHVLVSRLTFSFRDPHRGEIIVFTAPPRALGACGEGGVYVKRLIGLPGELIAEQQGQIYINGQRLKEPYLDPKERDDLSYTWPRLGPSQYFFLGDNRVDSCDSRLWGPVSRQALIGPVFATYWPPKRISLR